MNCGGGQASRAFMATAKTVTLHLLVKKDFYQDGAWYVAKCIEYDARPS